MKDSREVQTIIAYEFKDISVLETSLTHSSYANDYLGSSSLSNERLEFLGDAILDFVVGEELFRRFPDKQEGFLSKLRAEIVCEQSLAMTAERLGLNEFIRLGKGEEQKGGRKRHSIIADLVESVIAAVYIDGGFEEARRVIHLIMDDIIDKGCKGELPKDSKTELQEYAQKNGKQMLEYRIIGESGPDHDKTFTAGVYINGTELGTGMGKTKKEAESNAARCAISKIKK